MRLEAAPFPFVLHAAPWWRKPTADSSPIRLSE